MNSVVKKLIVPFGIVVLIVAVFLVSREVQEPKNSFGLLFGEKMIEVGVKKMGQPIEGFDAFMLKQAFLNLKDEDFDGVETREGHYELTSGALEYIRDKRQPITSAEQTISTKGYSTLLENILKRLDSTVTNEEMLYSVISELLSDDSIPILSRFSGKIVYSIARDVNESLPRSDCSIREGYFNTCGNSCAPDAEICNTACAYTCEFSAISNFKECIAAGFPAMESYPRQCRTDTGQHFVEKIDVILKPTGGVVGTITIGPTCPVMREGMEEECRDKAYKAEVIVKSENGKDEITRFTSDESGNFKVNIFSGTYLLEPLSAGGKILPRAEIQKVIVEKNLFTEVVILFDSGIR